jgi:triosephosphate isomerase
MDAARPRPLVAGNWKMNGLKASIAILDAVVEAYGGALKERIDLLVCPPATILSAAAETARGSGVAIGGQDCHAEPSGAFTGDLSAEMLADAGATHVIVGHSERRTLHGETDGDVRAKAEAARRAGLVAVVCVGETRGEREAGDTLAVIRRQVRGSLPGGAGAESVIVAYEPVWAIGTGLTPTPDDVAEVHGFLRDELGSIMGRDEAGRARILYGGSVKPANAGELMAVANVDGALVGGASLVADDFLAIAKACATRSLRSLSGGGGW